MSAADQALCNLCRRQFAKYTCPTCNVQYCALSCFRSQAHSQCSESFYKKVLETDIRSAPSKSTEEKRKMMELLKKFEEESINDASDEDDDVLGADLAKRLQGVDLETANPDELWSVLNAEERSKFMETLRDPNSELTQQLLSSEELERNRRKPWWEESDIEDKEGISRWPQAMMVPVSMVRPVPTSPSLVYNVCAICIAYVFTVRRLATSSLSSFPPNDPDREEAQRTICKLLPFLFDKMSTTVFSSLSEVITDLWSRFDEGGMVSQTLFAILQDSVSLLRPLSVAYAPSQKQDLQIDPRFHLHCRPILVLSDLSALFSGHDQVPGSSSRSPGSNHITQKLLFYAAHILSTPSQVLQFAASQMAIKARDLQEEETRHA
ncbi:hypothetical protein AX14_012166 [Amanita brunnescens Koide BX004]|nr:hypothetical protein AX14_012166 [Amanita brunnescens Koide BX004]